MELGEVASPFGLPPSGQGDHARPGPRWEPPEDAAPAGPAPHGAGRARDRRASSWCGGRHRRPWLGQELVAGERHLREARAAAHRFGDRVPPRRGSREQRRLRSRRSTTWRRGWRPRPWSRWSTAVTRSGWPSTAAPGRGVRRAGRVRAGGRVALAIDPVSITQPSRPCLRCDASAVQRVERLETMYAGQNSPWKIAYAYSQNASACCQKYTHAPKPPSVDRAAARGRPVFVPHRALLRRTRASRCPGVRTGGGSRPRAVPGHRIAPALPTPKVGGWRR